MFKSLQKYMMIDLGFLTVFKALKTVRKPKSIIIYFCKDLNMLFIASKDKVQGMQDWGKMNAKQA